MRRLVALAGCWAAALMLLAGVGGCGVPGPGGPADTYGLDLSAPQVESQSGAIVFVVDGLDATLFEQMLQAGEMPAIKQYFADRGLYVRRAVANVPSVTLANLTSLASGQFPGHHDITGVNWFDRNQLIWRNYETIAQKNTLDGDTLAPYIFSRFPDRATVSIFFQPHRMTTKFFENWTSAGPPFFFGWHQFVDRLTLLRLGQMARIARQGRQWPAVTYVYLLAPDFAAYGHGVGSKQYRQALVHTDRQIGRVLGDLERAGMLDRLVIALVSDHGMAQVNRHFELTDYLREELGLRVASKRLWEKTSFEGRLKYYRRFSVVTHGSGERYVAMCLRKPIRVDGIVTGYEPWTVRPDAQDLRSYPTGRGHNVDLIARLLEQEAVRAVAYAVGQNTARLAVAPGEVEFRQPQGPGGPISYRVISGQDPLGWAISSGASLRSRQWLDRTTGTNWPDLPAQLVAYFRSRRAGDLAVFAGGDWDLGGKLHAGHGALEPQDMHVPMMLAGPGIPPAVMDHARTVDLVPTLLALLGRPTLYSDGTNILPLCTARSTQAAMGPDSGDTCSPATQPADAPSPAKEPQAAGIVPRT